MLYIFKAKQIAYVQNVTEVHLPLTWVKLKVVICLAISCGRMGVIHRPINAKCRFAKTKFKAKINIFMRLWVECHSRISILSNCHQEKKVLFFKYYSIALCLPKIRQAPLMYIFFEMVSHRCYIIVQILHNFFVSSFNSIWNLTCLRLFRDNKMHLYSLRRCEYLHNCLMLPVYWILSSCRDSCYMHWALAIFLLFFIISLSFSDAIRY